MVQSRQKAENETENKDNNVGSLLDIDTCIENSLFENTL